VLSTVTQLGGSNSRFRTLEKSLNDLGEITPNGCPAEESTRLEIVLPAFQSTKDTKI